MNRLREIRKSRGLVLWHLASLCRTSPSVLSAIERYNYKPSNAMRDRIAEVLGVTITDLWPEEEQRVTES